MNEQILTPKQKRLALAKKRRQNWRRQVQNRVNKNEIPEPCRCGFIVFDLEGAGFLEEDITEIAAIRVSPDGDVQEVYQQLVRPITKLNRRVVAITGITEDMLADNDIMNINMACRRFQRQQLFLPKFLDTERIAKRLLPTQTGGKYGLDALMKYYGLQADEEHRALADCYSAWAVYRCLLREYENKKDESVQQ